MAKDAKGHGSDARGGARVANQMRHPSGAQVAKQMRTKMVAAHQSGVHRLARTMAEFAKNESGAGRNLPLEVASIPDITEAGKKAYHHYSDAVHNVIHHAQHFFGCMAVLAVAVATVKLVFGV